MISSTSTTTPPDVFADPGKLPCCPVCGAACSLLDVIDFNRTCGDQTGSLLGLSGCPVYYVLCDGCGFCHAPQFSSWTKTDFRERIYNATYPLIDPDYLEKRPRTNANTLIALFGTPPKGFRHLDYGGGNGGLSKQLRSASWESMSIDPFAADQEDLAALGKFELITAFEVFEHVVDIRTLLANLESLRAPNGLILFSTLVSDKDIGAGQRLTWWYAAPRNGHISLFSRKSLRLMGKQKGLQLGHFNEGLHMYFSVVPPWASHLFQPKAPTQPLPIQ